MFLRCSLPFQTISRFLELEFWKLNSYPWHYYFPSTAACALSSTVLLVNTIVSWMVHYLSRLSACQVLHLQGFNSLSYFWTPDHSSGYVLYVTLFRKPLSFCSFQEWIICSPPWSYGTSVLITISYNTGHTPLWILVYLPFGDIGTGFVITVILNKSEFGCASFIAIISDILVNLMVFVVLTSKGMSDWY